MSAFRSRGRLAAVFTLCASILLLFFAAASKHPAARADGVASDQIAAVWHVGRGVSTANGFQFLESVDLLLRDGWAYVGLAIPPSELNIDASKRTEPDKWRRWQKQGAKIAFQDQGTWGEAEGEVAEPLPAGSHLNVRLVARKALTFGLMGGSVFTQTIQFTPGGRFSRSKDTLHGTGTVQAASGFSGSAASNQGPGGGHSSAGGAFNRPGGGVATATASQTGGRGDLSGTYSVSGYTLVLRNDDGSEQHLWAFYPFAAEGDRNAIFVGDTTFRPE